MWNILFMGFRIREEWEIYEICISFPGMKKNCLARCQRKLREKPNVTFLRSSQKVSYMVNRKGLIQWSKSSTTGGRSCGIIRKFEIINEAWVNIDFLGGIGIGQRQKQSIWHHGNFRGFRRISEDSVLSVKKGNYTIKMRRMEKM